MQVDVAANPGSSSANLSSCGDRDDDRLCSPESGERRCEVKSSGKLPQVWFCRSTKIVLSRTRGGQPGKAQAQCVASVGSALQVSTGFQRIDEVVGCAFRQVQLSAQLRKGEAVPRTCQKLEEIHRPVYGRLSRVVYARLYYSFRYFRIPDRCCTHDGRNSNTRK